MDDFDTLPKMAGWHESKITMPAGQTVSLAPPIPNHTFHFYQSDASGWANGPKVGTLDFNGEEMKFEGNADESAKVFFEYLAKHFQQRLKDEYSRGYSDAKQGKESQR